MLKHVGVVSNLYEPGCMSPWGSRRPHQETSDFFEKSDVLVTPNKF